MIESAGRGFEGTHSIFRLNEGIVDGYDFDITVLDTESNRFDQLCFFLAVVVLPWRVGYLRIAENLEFY